MVNAVVVTLCILADMLLVRIHPSKPFISKCNTALAMYSRVSDFDSIALVQYSHGFRILDCGVRCVQFMTSPKV